jgi:molybdopterin-containing oxidoreductase family iron-sulfur binding subunit
MPEIDRRDFLKIVGLSAGAAATVACREPVEKIVPYLNQPEEVTPGIASFYASTCRECPASCGLIVKTREGRPIKVDGNPADPISQGRLCVRGQASLLRTYDASRLAGPLKRGADGIMVPTTWEDGISILVDKLREHSGKVAFLGGLETGTLDGLIDDVLAAIGSPNRVRFEPFAHEALRKANEQLFGTASVPQFRFERADLIVSFGADWQETWLSPVKQQIGYADARRGGKAFAVYVGPRLGLSGADMDEWLAPVPGTEIQLVLALLREVALVKRADLGALSGRLRSQTTAGAAEATGIPVARIRSLARRIADAEAPLVLPPGNELQGSNATGLAAAVQLLNFASGAIGKTVVFGPDHNLDRLDGFSDLKNLAGRLRSRAVGMLLVHGANPVYAAPALGFAEAMASTFTVSFASANDETTALADLVLPDHTPYESWGDSEPLRGVRLLQQPTIRPLRDTRATGDVLLEAARALGVGQSLPSGSFKDAIAARWADLGFDNALANGGVFNPAPPRSVSLVAGADTATFENAKLSGEGDLVLLVYPSLSLYDGRSARFATLQEVPNPVTKLVWGSYAELHPDTAARLGVELGDMLRVTSEAGQLELPVVVNETLRSDVIAIEAGQGHQPVEPGAPDPDNLKLRSQIGQNAYALLSGTTDAESGALAWLSAKVRAEKTGATLLMPLTQPTFDQEGRGIAQATSLAAVLGLDEGGHEAPASGGEHHERPYADAMQLETVDFDPAGDARSPDYRWGMVIDLDTCTGCNACVTACVQENNIFAIGEQLVRQGREMHWIRLERYVEHHGDEIEVRHAPMLCQHCGSAPCESVCPTFATYHTGEGLNAMVPNRCIGTRYCSNNCPYKVRRFNYFPYDRFLREPEQLRLNPDVTVRSKGVMEKCSFCVQRISAAKDQAAFEGRTVRDGEVTPACAQTCPSQAITFGNHKDPASRVSKQRADGRAYWVFHHLNTRPAVTYLKSIRRGETGKV